MKSATFSISCPHPHSSSTFSCPTLREEDSAGHYVKIICHRCFEHERVAAEALSLAPLSADHFCMDCGRNPARYSKSLMMAMCDPCRSEQGSSFLQFAFLRKVSKNAGRELPNDIYEGRLFLGSQDAAANSEIFTRLQITHVLVCGNGLSRFYEDDELYGSVKYHQLPIDDSLDQNLQVYLPYGVQFIENAINAGGNVLVHCHAGVSRSASLVIAWIMQRMQCDYHAAYSYVKSKRGQIHPNSNFVDTLQGYWEPLCMSPAASASSLSDAKSVPSSSSFSNHTISTSMDAKIDAKDAAHGNAEQNNLSVEIGQTSSLDEGLRTAMKSTSNSIRRFSADRIDPLEHTNSSHHNRHRRCHNPYDDEDDLMGLQQEEEEEDDFILVLKSDQKEEK